MMPAVADQWNHPKLGSLTYDRRRDAWTGSVDVPAFESFTHIWDHHVSGRCQLIFETHDEQQTPSPAAVELAVKLIDNAKRFSRTVVDTLWNEFNGRGPRSTIWWRGGLAQVVENGEGEDVPPLTSAEALFGWMHPKEIVVHNAGSDAKGRLVIEVTFAAVFEVEHGVGILTDGESILGTGYVGDMEFYEPE